MPVITYNLNGGNISGSTTNPTQNVTVVATLPVPTRSNYVFLGWSTINTGTTHNGPHHVNDTMQTIVGTSNMTSSTPNRSNAANFFVGTSVPAAITVYALWWRTWTVRAFASEDYYVANNTSKSSIITHRHGLFFTVNGLVDGNINFYDVSNIIDSGYKVAGWVITSSNPGTSMENIQILDTIIGNNYAIALIQLEDIQVTVTYVLGQKYVADTTGPPQLVYGGYMDSPTTVTYTVNAGAGMVNENTPEPQWVYMEPNLYLFDGWWTGNTENCPNHPTPHTDLYNGYICEYCGYQLYRNIENPTSSIILYARWMPAKFSISYMNIPNNCSHVCDDSCLHIHDSTCHTECDPSCRICTHVCANNCPTISCAQANCQVPGCSGNHYVCQHTVCDCYPEYCHKICRKTCNHVCDDNCRFQVPSDKLYYIYGEGILLPQSPHIAWYTEPDGGVQVLGISPAISPPTPWEYGDKIYYAVSGSSMFYNVIFNPNGGTFAGTTSNTIYNNIPHGTPVFSNSNIYPGDPVRSGYTFLGWSDSFDYITSSITIVAMWNDSINESIVWVMTERGWVKNTLI